VYLQGVLAPLGVKVTRIARGLPAGSTIEYASRATLADALDGRRTVQ
jgi:recombination protein RecR